MFKIDWPTAIGGVVIGYFAKGKVEQTKQKFKGIYTSALDNFKESLEEESQSQTTNGGHNDH